MPTIESQLFIYDDCDNLNDGSYMYYNVTTLVNIKGIPAGTVFSYAILSFTDSYLIFQDQYANEVHRFSLKITIA